MHAREHKTRYNKEKIIRYQEDEKTMTTGEEEENNLNGIKDHLSAP